MHSINENKFYDYTMKQNYTVTSFQGFKNNIPHGVFYSQIKSVLSRFVVMCLCTTNTSRTSLIRTNPKRACIADSKTSLQFFFTWHCLKVISIQRELFTSFRASFSQFLVTRPTYSFGTNVILV